MKKVLLSFTQIAPAEKASYYRNVVAKFTGNALLPTPIISLADLTTALDKFETNILAARDGGHLAVAVMHDSEIAIDKMFRSLAHYVDMIADGDETIILSAGFQASKDSVPRVKAPITANDGDHSGSVKINYKANERAGAYIIQWSKDALPSTDNGWEVLATVTQTTYVVSNLIVGCYYYFRVASVTPDGTTEFSEPVRKLVV
jgi:hypothetical protein